MPCFGSPACWVVVMSTSWLLLLLCVSLAEMRETRAMSDAFDRVVVQHCAHDAALFLARLF